MKALKAAGDKEGAAAVKALRKPTATAWALNQVARSHGDDVEELLALSASLGEAQRQGDQAEVRRLSKGRRDLVTRLVNAGVKLAGPARRDELVATLEAASVDEAAAEELRAGRLTKELTPSLGFGALGELPEAAPGPKADDDTKARKEAEEAAAQQAAAEKAADAAWAHLAALEEQLAGARRQAEELDRKAGR